MGEPGDTNGFGAPLDKDEGVNGRRLPASGPGRRRQPRRMMTDACPSFARLMRIAEGESPLPDERDHLSEPCPYCELTLRLSFLELPPSTEVEDNAEGVGGALLAALNEVRSQMSDAAMSQALDEEATGAEQDQAPFPRPAPTGPRTGAPMVPGEVDGRPEWRARPKASVTRRCLGRPGADADTSYPPTPKRDSHAGVDRRDARRFTDPLPGLQRMRQQVTTSGPWLILAVSLIATYLGLHIHLQNRAAGDQSIQTVAPVVALAFPWIGAVIASRRAANPVGWLYCLGALVGMAFFADQYATRPLVTGSGPLPGGVWLAWVATWAWIPGLFAPVTLGILLFPDGRPPSPRWRPLVWATTALITLTTLFVALAPGLMGHYNLMNPLGVESLPRLGRDLLLVCGFGLTAACLGALVVRWRRSPDQRREQLEAVVGAAALAFAARVLAVPMTRGTVPLAAYQALGATTLACIPASVLFAVVRRRLYHFRRSEIIRLGNHSIVVGGVLAVSLSTWAVLRALNVPRPLVLAALVVVVEPLRRYLMPRVEDRRRAYRAHTVLLDLARKLEDSAGPDTVLPMMAETLARSLELPYVAIELRDRSGGVIGLYGSGEVASDVETLHLIHQDRRVAQLLFVSPTLGERLDPGERLLLKEIATHLTVAVYAVGLTLAAQGPHDRSGTGAGVPVAAVAFDSGACFARWSLRYRRRRSPVVSVLAPRRRAVSAAGQTREQ